MRGLIAIVLLVGGVFLSPALDHAADSVSSARTSPLAQPAMSIALARSELSVRGTTASSAHESALHQLAVDQFPDKTMVSDFVPGVLPGNNWEVVSTRLVYALATLDSGEAQLAPTSIQIRGVGSDQGVFKARVDFLREVIPASAKLETDVVFLPATRPYEELCARAFSELVIGPIAFEESSAELRDASYVALDRITDFAHDCPGTTIAISGHTDASGNEQWNQQLSLARARAVADHIAGKGIDAGRLLVAGLGSSEPVADNDTARGRELNRRIEIELR